MNAIFKKKIVIVTISLTNLVYELIIQKSFYPETKLIS